MSIHSPSEKGLEKISSPESSPLIVHQPAKMEALIQDLTTIENLSQRVSEVGGEDRSGDMGGGAGGAMQTGGGSQPSPRDIAIAAIPAPAVMQKQLESYIADEVKKLSKQASHVAHLSQPGAAYRLNELYAKIRRLNSLLASLLEVSYDVLKRLFIRVFIDRQTIL